MKKKGFILSLVLLLMMSLVPTFAEPTLEVMGTDDSQETSGEKLFDYGFITGNEKGLDEGSNLTRGQMAVILADFYGLKEEASQYDQPANFTDVRGHWASPYIAFGQEKGWFSGYGDHSYRPDQTVSSKELAVYVLNVLGYNGDYTFDNAEDFARGLDLVLEDGESMLRGDAFDTIWSALHLKAKGDTEAIGVKLGKLPADTLAAGAFGVESVEMRGITTLHLHFNQKVESTTSDIKDYLTIKVNSEKLSDQKYNIFLINQEAYIIFNNDKVAQNDDIQIVLDNFTNPNTGDVIGHWEKDIHVLDTTFPEITSAEVIGQHTIRLDVSEFLKLGVNPEDAIEINDGKVSVKEVTFYIDPSDEDFKSYIQIETYTTFKDGDTVTLKIKPAYKDYVGLTLLSDPLTLDVTAQTEAPTIDSYRCDNNLSVTLNWSQPVDSNQNDLTSYIYHTNPSNTVTNGVYADGSKSIDLSFEGHRLPEGTAYIYVKKGAFKDLWGNENEEIVLPIEVPVSKALEVKKVTYKDDQTLQVLFNDNFDSKYLSDTSTLNSDTFILKKDDKVIHNSFTVTFDAYKQNILTLHYSRSLEAGDYTLTVKELKNANEKPMSQESVVAFTATDSKAPEFPTSVMSKQEGKNEGTFYFIFNEEMALTGPYSILDLSKYTLTENFDDGSSYVFDFEKYADDISMEVINEGFGVAIHVSEDALAKMKEDIESAISDKHFKSNTFEIARVADAEGNVTSDLSSGPITVTNKVTDVAIDIEKVEVISDNQAKVYFSDHFSEFEDSDITFEYMGVKPKVSMVDVTTVDHKDIATYTFAKERRTSEKHVTLLESGPKVFLGFAADTDGSDLKVTVTGHDVTENGTTSKVITSHNELGNYLAKGDTSYSVAKALIYDKTAPSVEMIDHDDTTDLVANAVINSKTTVRIEFDEAIHPGSVSYSSFEAVGHTVTKIEVSGRYIIITINDKKLDAEGNVLKDAEGNDLSDKFELQDTIIQKAPISDNQLNKVEGIEFDIYQLSIAEKM